MSKTPKKSSRIISLVLIIAVLLGICFTCVTLYAKREMKKEKFSLPILAPQESLSELPAGDQAILEYAQRVYASAITADDAETSRSTEIKLQPDFSASTLKDADKDVIDYIKDYAADEIRAYYPDFSGVIAKEAADVPRFQISASDVLSAQAAQGREDEHGEIVDTDCYFLTLTVDPRIIDANAVKDGEICRKITETVSKTAQVNSLSIDVQALEYSFKVDRLTDKVLNYSVSTVYTVEALTDVAAYAQLGTQKTDWSYTEKINCSFSWYGARFTERQMAVNKGAMKALPAAVTVNSQATKDDYELTFTVSQPDVIRIDEDGVMNVDKVCSEPVTIEMTLQYDGHVYQDSITIYITELEVATNG